MSAPSAAPASPRTTDGCRYCWMCRQACPVGHVTARETLTPHAWALMIGSVARGQLTWTREVADVMYSCADCGLCQAHCATDQPLPDAINQSRTEIAAAGGAPPIVYELDRQLKAYGGAYGSTKVTATSATGPSALFLGDAAPHSRPAAVDAARRLLSAAGRSPVPIATGRSSGLLANTLGLRATAIDLAQAVLADVRASGAAEVLVLGPTDRWTFEQVYKERLGVAWPAGVVVREVTDVLAEAVAAGRLTFRPESAGAYAYHDPCHTPRLGHSRPAPRALLAAAFGTAHAKELFWREHRAHPCGATGGLEFTTPAIAARLADARLADAAAAGAEWIVTDEPACLHQLAGRPSGQVAVRGLYEVLVERL
jgi:Fe-S oxidoreductase